MPTREGGKQHLFSLWEKDGMREGRLTQEHRMVYLVRDDRIDFLQARYHY